MKNLCKKQLLPFFAALLSFALLTGCTAPAAPTNDTAQDIQNAHDTGYSEGYNAGYAAGSAASSSPAGTPPAVETTDPAMNSSGFVSITDVIPDAILEIRYYSSYNFVGERIAGYEQPVALLTKQAAEALRSVSDTLAAQGYRLKIYDAYRPQCAVDHFKAWAQDLSDTRMKPYFYPEEDKAQLFDRGYIASRSGHSRGSTVDLTLFDMKTGKDVDMGGSFDYFGTRSHTDYTDDLTEAQLANRRLLRDTMLAHGFDGISTEWWHFTLKNEPYPDTYFAFPVEQLS